MMDSILHSLLTRQLWIGFVLGYVTRYAYCHLHARWLDKHRPLAHGKRHRRPLVNRSILGGSLALGVILFSLVQVQGTSRRTDENTATITAMANAAIDCENQRRAYAAVDHKLQVENDAYAAVERELNAQSIQVNSDWISLVVDPPQEIFDLHTTDPAYQAWARGVNQNYLTKRAEIDKQLADATAKREAVVAERAAHPVPEPTCGK